MTKPTALALGALLAIALVVGLVVGGSDSSDGDGGSSAARDGDRTVTVTEVRERRTAPSRSSRGAALAIDPQEIYDREAQGVVTVYSIFGKVEGGLSALLKNGGEAPQAGLGSGFVLNSDGEIATNAHVVTDGTAPNLEKADQLFVEFADSNRVPAKLVGYDPNSDVALLRIEPDGLDIDPLPLGRSRSVTVGEPVAAIGSPFGQRQSLSVGVVSARDRDIKSLTSFSISGAIQTDAAINKGNSGGPLVDAQGRVIGINAQINSESGDGSGVGFAIPVDLARRVLHQLREDGRASYAYLGVSSVPLYPQLASHFKLPVRKGAWVQSVQKGSPAAEAGLKPGRGDRRLFQAEPYVAGGDVIVSIGGRRIEDSTDLSEAVASLRPGRDAEVVLYRAGKRRTVQVPLRERPLTPGG